MGTFDFKYNKVPLFGRKTGISILRCLLPRNILYVPASRYYCDVTKSYHNVCAKLLFRIERGSDGCP